MTDKVIVLTTAGSEDEARKIASTLVERQLAACVNIVPRIQSVYRWRGAVEEAAEWLLLIKTHKMKQEAVQMTVEELHSYDLPEFISIAIETGSSEYLHWLDESLGIS